MIIIAISDISDTEWKKWFTQELVSLLSQTSDCLQKNIVAIEAGSEISYDEFKVKYGDASYVIIAGNIRICGLKPDLVLYPFDMEKSLIYKDPYDCISLLYGSTLSPGDLNHYSEKLEMPLNIMKKIAWLCGVRTQSVQGVILAGGRSSRMGTDKARLKLGESTLSGLLVSIIRPYCDDIVISVAKGKKSPVENIAVIEDVTDGMGPLMGIYSALQNSSHRICLITACDIPYIHPLLIRKMLSFTDEYDVVVPSFNEGRVEPLMGIYTRNCLMAISEMLNNNKLRVSDLFAICKTKRIFDFNGQWYANLNTPDEYLTYCNSIENSILQG